MSLVKREYTDQETVITAENMNAIQDAILDLEDGLFSVDNNKSGKVITITDATKRGFRSLSIYGKTVQNGAPTPDTPVDLVSLGAGGNINVTVAGKNLWNGKFENIAFGSNDTTNFVVSILNNTKYRSIVVPVIPGEKYSFSRGAAFHDWCYIAFTHDYPESHTALIFEDGNTSDALTGRNKGSALVVSGITVPDDCHYMVIYINNDNTATDVTQTWYQIETGETATEYEPHKGQTLSVSTPNGLPGIPVDNGGNYTDANGQQWVCDEIDLARGVYVQRVGQLDFGSMVWYWEEDYGMWRSQEFGAGKARTPLLCETIPYVLLSIYGGTVMGTLINNPYNIWARNGSSESTPAGKAYYQMHTPIETPLSKEELAAYRSLYTYRNNTTVSNDAGAYMELEYVMDAKKYIDSLVIGGSSATILNATVE